MPQQGGGYSSDAIIAGGNAQTGAYPWMAALITKASSGTNSQNQFCGGSLIAPTWVLTAAHCVDWQKPGKFQVLVGRDDLDGSGGQLLDVSEIISNPRFDHDTVVNDVALVRLAAPATVSPVALPTAVAGGALSNATVTALGWGSTTGYQRPVCTLVFDTQSASVDQTAYSCDSLAYRKQAPVRLLQSGQISVLSTSECYKRYVGYLTQHSYSIPSSLHPDQSVQAGALCTIDLSNKVSVCFGDSGGPLLALLDGKPTLVGITSFGIEKHCQGTYSLQFFTEVARYLDFISQTMAGSKALGYSQHCPATATLSVDMQAAVAGQAQTTLSWSAVDGATGYSLLYVQLPRQDAAVGRQSVPASVTQLSLALRSGSRYLVGVRAMGKDCDGEVSKTVEISVP